MYGMDWVLLTWSNFMKLIEKNNEKVLEKIRFKKKKKNYTVSYDKNKSC